MTKGVILISKVPSPAKKNRPKYVHAHRSITIPIVALKVDASKIAKYEGKNKLSSNIITMTIATK